MFEHSQTSVLFINDTGSKNMQMLVSYFRDISHLQLDDRPQLPAELSQWDVVVSAIETFGSADLDRLTAFVRHGGGWLNIIGREINEIPALFGAC